VICNQRGGEAMKALYMMVLLVLGLTLGLSQAVFAYTPPPEFDVLQVQIPTNDIAFSTLTNQLLVTVPSSAGLGLGNSITHLDPHSGKVLKSVFIGSEPGPIGLSNNGGTAYIGMGGAPLVRRYDVQSMTAGQQSALGSDPNFGFLYAGDITVKPSDPNTFVVSRFRKGVSPPHGGVAAFVNGVQLPNTTQEHTGSDRVEFGDQPNIVFGSSGSDIRILTLDANGLQETNVIPGVNGSDIEFDAGRIYTSAGVVFDPALGIPVGAYGSGVSVVEPDSAHGVTFAIESSNFGDPRRLVIFDQNTFAPIKDYELNGVTGTPSDLISLGDGGLALRTVDSFNNTSMLYLLTAIPEPHAWAMFMVALILIAIRRVPLMVTRDGVT